MVDRDLEPLEDVLPVLRHAVLEARPPLDDLVPVLEEVPEHRLEVHHLRLAVDEREHDDAEGGLELRALEELVQDDLRHRVALQFDDDPDPVAVGLVAEVGDVRDLLVAHETRDLLDEPCLVHHEGDLADDDAVATVPSLLDVGLRAHHDPAAAQPVGFANPGSAEDRAPGGEVGTPDDLHQLVEGRVGRLDEPVTGSGHLAEVVRGDVRGHAHRDARRAVDEEVGERGGQNGRLLQAVVEVRRVVDRVLVDITEQFARESVEPGLGVAVGRGGVAVHGPEVSLPVDERIAERELLRHPDERIVDGRIAVRVVFPDYVADDGRALSVGSGRAEAGLVHRVQDPPVDRLQAVANVGQGPLYDDAHRVVDERFAHFFFERSLLDAFYALGGHGFPLELAFSRSSRTRRPMAAPGEPGRTR